MSTRSISISLEAGLLEALDGELSRTGVSRQPNRSAAVAEALELWLQHRRLAALEGAYAALEVLNGGGDLEAAGEAAAAMGEASLEGLHG